VVLVKLKTKEKVRSVKISGRSSLPFINIKYIAWVDQKFAVQLKIVKISWELNDNINTIFVVINFNYSWCILFLKDKCICYSTKYTGNLSRLLVAEL